MKQRVLQSKVIHTNDTQVKLIDKSLRSTRLARFWACIGDHDHPYTIYDFTETRQRAGRQAFLKDYAGYLQAVAYGGYDGIYVDAGARSKKSHAGPIVDAIGGKLANTMQRGRIMYSR